ncbi:MAG: TonB-dependent receptor, partial [Chthoniobacteraceae bacterium]
KYYTQLPGGILESFGRLFKNDLKVFVYPLQDQKTKELTTVDNLQVALELRKLYGYLIDRKFLVQLDNYNPDYLPIFSREVFLKIGRGDDSWEKMVPAEVAAVIKKRGFFGYHRQTN